MRLAIGEDNNFTCFERDRLPASGRGKATARCHDMIGNQMIGARQDLRQDQLSWRRCNGPWFLGRDFEEYCAGQPHCLQQIR
jgi:hypothetical protein